MHIVNDNEPLDAGHAKPRRHFEHLPEVVAAPYLMQDRNKNDVFRRPCSPQKYEPGVAHKMLVSTLNPQCWECERRKGKAECVTPSPC